MENNCLNSKVEPKVSIQIPAVHFKTDKYTKNEKTLELQDMARIQETVHILIHSYSFSNVFKMTG